MEIYIVYKEYLGWENPTSNGTDIIGAYKELETAEKAFQNVYEDELDYFDEEEIKIIYNNKQPHYVNIETNVGNTNIYIKTILEVK